VKKRWLKLLMVVGSCVVVVGGLAAWGGWVAMKRGIIRINKYDIRSEGILQIGDKAPDLELQRADGSGSVQLSDVFSERPLVLVFGSYT